MALLLEAHPDWGAWTSNSAGNEQESGTSMEDILLEGEKWREMPKDSKRTS